MTRRRRLPARIARYGLVLWAAATLNFVLPHLAPGDPVDYVFGGAANSLSEADRDALRAQYGVDGGLLTQYGRYWSGLASGDLGVSVDESRPVTDILLERVPWTLALVLPALALSAVVGVLAGVAAARRRGRRRDLGLVVSVLALDAVPGFWIGMVLIATLSVQLGWFPSYGAAPLGVDGGWAWWTGVAHRLVLPVVTVALAILGSTFLLARGSMLATLDEPFVLLAEAKGCSPRRVAFRHALRNALLPVTTHLTLAAGVLLSGVVVVETVFTYPGIGRLIHQAVTARDYPLLQGAFLFVTVAVVAANLLADVCYPLLDPRVRRPSREPA